MNGVGINKLRDGRPRHSLNNESNGCESCIQGLVPFRSTKPSTTGMTLAVSFPTSINKAVPLPAAKLKKFHVKKSLVRKKAVRAKHR